jgi:hypothetical protein
MQSRVIEDGDICTCCSANILLSKSLTEATASKPSVRLQSKKQEIAQRWYTCDTAKGLGHASKQESYRGICRTTWHGPSAGGNTIRD